MALAAILIMAAASTGDFRRFERFAMVLVFGSLLLVPVFLMVHPPAAQIARDFVVPLSARPSRRGNSSSSKAMSSTSASPRVSSATRKPTCGLASCLSSSAPLP